MKYDTLLSCTLYMKVSARSDKFNVNRDWYFDLFIIRELRFLIFLNFLFRLVWRHIPDKETVNMRNIGLNENQVKCFYLKFITYIFMMYFVRCSKEIV